MTPELLPEPRFVSLDSIRQAIRRFELAGKNPYGMNTPIPGGQPVWLEIRTGEPAPRKTGPEWPASPAFQIPLYTNDCDNEQKEAYTNGVGIETDHAVLYPMTKAYVQRQWHRAYAYDVVLGEVTEVRLLVSEKQEPGYKAAGHKSAHEWVLSVERSGKPVFDGELYRMEPEPDKGSSTEIQR